MNTESLKQAIIEENNEEVREHVKAIVQESIIESSDSIVNEARTIKELPKLMADISGMGFDRNGNKAIQIKPEDGQAFSIQTNNGYMNFIHSNFANNQDIKNATPDEVERIEGEIVRYVKNYGTPRQKRILT